MTERVAPYHYTACGLDYVWLTNGFERTSTEYGDATRIHNQEGLHEAIADSIITGPQRIRGAEVRFLRSMLGLSQEGLADLLDSSRPSVARWEANPGKPIEVATDKWMRIVYAKKTSGDQRLLALIDLLMDLDEAQNGRKEIFVEQKKTWHRDGALMCAP